MICLDNTDVLEAWSDTNAVIDFTLHGLVSGVFTNLDTRTLNNTPNTVVYTAAAAISVVSATFTNTGGSAATVNFKLDPANGGNDTFLIPIVSLPAGASLVFDGAKFSVMDTSGNLLQSGLAQYFTADSTFLVGTGAGTFAEESGATLRTSIGVGTGDTPQFTGLGLGVARSSGKLHIQQDSTDNGIFVDMGASGTIGISVDSESTTSDALNITGKYVQQNTQDVSGGYALYVSRNIAEAGSFALASFIDDNASNTQTTLYVRQDGTGDILKLFDGATEAFTVKDGGDLYKEGTIFMKEQAEASGNTAAYGQIWVDLATPNELYFTDDADTDTQISSHPMDAPDECYVNPDNKGLEWVGKKVQKYLGIIFWQKIDGTIVEETFEDYNLRTGSNLVKKDINEFIAKSKEKWKKDWIDENTTEVEVLVADSIVEETKEKEDKEKIKEFKTEYELDVELGEIKEKQIPVYDKTIETKKKLKDNHRFDKDTGKIFKKVVPTDADAEQVALTEFNDGIPDWIKNRL